MDNVAQALHTQKTVKLSKDETRRITVNHKQVNKASITEAKEVLEARESEVLGLDKKDS